MHKQKLNYQQGTTGMALTLLARVNGYSKSNGTYVAHHYKTTNNNAQKDNYIINQNYNYHNGKTGTRKAKL